MHKSSEIKICAFEGCGRNVKSQGLCNAHYQQKKAGLTLRRVQGSRLVAKCAFEGCERDALCRKLCDGHYQQLRAGRELSPLQQIHATCTVPGCSNPHDAKGLCSTHYSQQKSLGHTRPLCNEPSPIEVGGCVTLYGKGEDGRTGHLMGHTWIDAEDVCRVGTHRWRRSANGYAETKINGKRVFLHRFLMNPPDESEIDHIDGDKLNNRKANLRVVTQLQNAQNKPTSGATGHRGVFYEAKKNLYRVIVIREGKRYSGGRHRNIEDAIARAKEMRAELFTHHNEDRSERK
jgi:hypothetical protein